MEVRQMKYKIMLLLDNSSDGTQKYFKFYQDKETEEDWESEDKEATITEIQTLLEDYSLSDIRVVVDLDITSSIDIPSLPTSEENENVESEEK